MPFFSMPAPSISALATHELIGLTLSPRELDADFAHRAASKAFYHAPPSRLLLADMRLPHHAARFCMFSLVAMLSCHILI